MSSLQATVPSLSTRSLEQVSDRELRLFADLIYTRTGIRVSPQKKMLMSNRLRRRLRETGIEGFTAYYDHLRRLPAAHAEWDAFLQEITTHETYLFRDEQQWKWFREVYLPELSAGTCSGNGLRKLRIWSAAASTGDEAYTVACCVAACLTNVSQWSVQVFGTDIGVGAVEQARAGVFGERAMRLVPDDYRRRFFTKAKDANLWQAKQSLRAMVSFRQHNLMHPLRDRPFDLVILKNVLIYFDAMSKQTVMANVRNAVRAGGLLMAGAAEGIAEYVRDFQRLQPWLFRRL